MTDGALRIALVCEDHAHRFLATTLADRVLLQEATRRAADWIDADSLIWHRSYCGPPDSDDTFYSMVRVKQAAENLGAAVTIMGRPIKLRGFIDGQPLAPAAGENVSRSPHVTELPGLSERTLHDLERLERRGDGSRLNAYLEAVRTTLVPRLMPGPPRP
jgi:hypothetical protein